MGNDACSDDLILLAARLYYVDGLSQANVARLANVSQAKVSRLLAKARRRGFVRITVAAYDAGDHLLEERLEKECGLRRATVIKTSEGLEVEELRQCVSHFAAASIVELLPAQGVLAVAGGRTLRRLVHRMSPPPDAAGLTVVQAMGNFDGSVGVYDAVDLGHLMAQRWRGTFLSFDAPAILPDPAACRALLESDAVRSALERSRSARIALIGIGTAENSVFVERGVLTKSDAIQLAKAGAVGEICGRFYDRDGNECATSFRDRTVSMQLDDLRRTEEVVAVVAGSDRTKAIRGAVAGGLIKSLVIDRDGATALLESASG